MASGPQTQFLTRASGLQQLRRITEHEKYAVTSLWDKVEQRYNELGRLVFVRLFELYPTYKNFFMEMTGFEDPFDSLKFKKHMMHVFLPTLGGLINHLDNSEAVFEAVKRLGIHHRKKEFGLSRDNVEHMGECVLTVVKQNIKDYTEEQEKALTKVMNIIVDLFSSSLEGKTI